ncbi:putative ammonium transporter 1 [Blattella germanica]|nr:putative ammonium transporter 1 [Blattella germanica]
MNLGYEDYSGCGPVHVLAGVCSFFGAFIIGPRIGKFGFKSNIPQDEEELVGHSVPLTGIGGLILVTGFLAFNGAAIGKMSEPGYEDIIARVIINTILGGSGGSLIMQMACKFGVLGKPVWSFTHTLNAGLAGMVSVCAGADKFPMWGSTLSGILAALVYLTLHKLMIYMKVDDPLDTVAVHFGGGLCGLVSASFFQEEGIVFGASSTSAMVNLLQRLVYRMIGVVAIIVWSTVGSCIVFGLLKYFGKLRVSEEQELRGMLFFVCLSCLNSTQ